MFIFNIEMNKIEKSAKVVFYLVILALLIGGIAKFGDMQFVDVKKGNSNPFANNRDFGISTLDLDAYNNLPLRQVQEISNDFSLLAQKGFYYQPWVQVSEPLFKSKNVNILTDETGLVIRHTFNPDNTSNYPVYKVYVFGSSCTFGYNVSDSQTICTYLSHELNQNIKSRGIKAHVEVVNYGRAFYDASMEMQLYMDLLKLGHRPSLSIFLSGVTPGLAMDIPYCTDVMINEMYQVQFGDYQNTSTSLSNSSSFLERLGLVASGEKGNSRINIAIEEEDNPRIDFFANRFAQNKEIIKHLSDIYKVKCLFFAQPNPHYNYPVQFLKDSSSYEAEERIMWGQLYDLLLPKHSDIISLHFLFKKWNKKAIVDYSHYSPGFNRFIAQEVCSHIPIDTLWTHPYKLDSMNATGLKRNLARRIFEMSQ